MSTDEQWFITDAPISLTEKDAFGHADVANNLKTMIEGAGDHRLMIGLLGGFGVGKSTVIELLKNNLEGSGNYGVVRLSAERHEQVGFHRSMIFAFAEQLQENKLIKESKAEELLRELEFSTTRMAVDPLAAPLLTMGKDIVQKVRPLLKRLGFWTLLGVLVFGLFLTAAALLGLDIWGFGVGLGGAIGVAVATLGPAYGFVTRLTGVQKYFESLLAPGQVSHLKPRVEAADGFERTFANLVEAVGTRLVIAVDDIDRLSATQVVEALNAVRSFQLTCRDGNRPIFIVSVDDGIVRQAIKGERAPDPAPESYSENTLRDALVDDPADAYLNRLFVQQQQMPTHAQGDLVKYAASLLDPAFHAGAKSLGDYLDSVLTVLIYDKVNDPRHVIRLLNGFFGDFRIASRREGRQGVRSVSPGTITKNVRTLAQMTVLRIDFPDFYARLRDDVSLIDLVLADAAGNVGPEETWRAEFRSYSSLRDFIGRTQGFLEGVPSLIPFLYLGQDDIDKILGDKMARDIRGMLVNRQTGELQRAIQEWVSEGDETKLESLVELIVLTMRSGQGLELQNALSVVLDIADALPEKGLGDIAGGLSAALARAPGAVPIAKGLLRLGKASPAPHVKATLGRFLIRNTQDPEYGRAIAVLQNRTTAVSLLDPEQVRKYLESNLSHLSDSGTVDDFERWLSAFEGSLSEDLAPTMASAILALAQRADTEPSDEFIEQALKLFAEVEIDEPKWPGLTAAKTLAGGAEGAYFRLAVGALYRLNLTDLAPLTAAAQALDELVPDKVAHLVDLATDLPDEILAICRRAIEATREGDSKAALSTLNIVDRLTASLVLNVEEDSVLVPASLVFESMVERRSAAAQEMAEAFVGRWTRMGSTYGSRACVAVVIEHLDDLTEKSQVVLVDAMIANLQPGTETKLHGQASKELPEFLSTATGKKSSERLVTSLLPHVAYNSPQPLDQATRVLSAVYDLTGSVPDSVTQQFLNQLRTVFSYGGAATEPALRAICRVAWPPSVADAAVTLLSQQVTLLQPEHYHEFVTNLPNLELASLPDSLEAGLVADLRFNSGELTAAQIAGATTQLSLNSALLVSSEVAAAVPSAAGKVDASNHDQMSLAMGLMVEHDGSLDPYPEWRLQLLKILYQGNAECYESVLCRYQAAQSNAEATLPWSARQWELLCAPLTLEPGIFLESVNDSLKAATGRMINTLPVAEGALGNDALCGALIVVLKSILETYIRQHSDPAAAGQIARTMRDQKESRTAAREALGQRAPNRGTPRREAYDSAKAALEP
ncbi:P-loop NTPase fold protein [Arthrobacter sp. Soil736]|uniref:P-loop NTPase fold protein n=1 Tax=Arthrobacter sp. Soil736 TaxID=1736395 RepID=UPI00138F30DA|nr:P-loop NTPase fold protein [Arthrobacter sp. Soil736]